ncbi:hypothetical protein [Novosphingobium sp. Chol11]|uniref:hypothetical protein n=1 Tax=Novosphingobium sp. Chol11 TaxID=1385763 RepID=UPI000BE3E843|nr:hypothetical protein [Novosphingobium sp. Chol11]
MKVVGYIVVLALAAAALRQAIMALVLIGLVFLLWAAIFRPQETFALLAFSLFAVMLTNFPAAVAGFFALVLVVDVLRRLKSGVSPREWTDDR